MRLADGRAPQRPAPHAAPRPISTCRDVYRAAAARHRFALLLGVLLTLAQSAVVIPIPLLVRRGVDVAIPQKDRVGLLVIALGLVGLTAAAGLLGVVAQRRVQAAVKVGTATLRKRIADQVLRTDYSALGDIDPAAAHERLLNDPGYTEQELAVLIRDVLPGITTILGLSVVLFRIDPLLTLATAIVAPLIYLTNRLFRPHVARVARGSQRAYESLGSRSQVTMRVQPLVRARGAAWIEREELHERIEGLRTASITRSTVNGLFGAMQTTVVSLASAVTLCVGGLAVMSDRISLGALLSFFAAVALLRTPITALATLTPTLVDGAQAAERIDAFLAGTAIGPAPLPCDEPGEPPRELALDRVTYRYPSADAPAVTELSLALSSGRVLALAGPNGAGKTTVMCLLLGLLQPESGRVLVDGSPVDGAGFERLRQHVGVSFQHAQFFPGTVRQNLSYGRSGTSDDDLHEALATAEAGGVLERIPGGLDGWIGTDGDRLSGGERQRLAIARAIIGRPSLVVLDEPSNHLPVRVVERILGRLRARRSPPAVLLISHDTGVLAVADETLRLAGHPDTEALAPEAAFGAARPLAS